MSPLTDFFPPKLINWLANAVNPYVGAANESVEKQNDTITENARYNRDFHQSDDVAHSRLNAIFKNLEQMLQFANPADKEVNHKISNWVQSNVGKAFWPSVADWLLENGFEEAYSDLREFSEESGY
jgi:hypothetical protein